MAGQPLDAAVIGCRNRVLQNRGICSIPRWPDCSMVLPPRHGGGHNVPGRPNKVSRIISPRSSEARTAPTVLFHEPRTSRDGRPVHDPVSGSLPTTGRRRPRSSHSGYLPVQLKGASTDDSRTYRFLQPDYRASHRTRPCNRSDTTYHDFLHGLFAKFPSAGGQSFPTSSSMHGLLRLRPSGS